MQAILIDTSTGQELGSAGAGDAPASGPRARRLLMVKDIPAPHAIITDRLLDYDAYPRMIKGCDSLQQYAHSELPRPGKRPLQMMSAKYKIHALHMHFTYYMVHEFDPDERCMVFVCPAGTERSHSRSAPILKEPGGSIHGGDSISTMTADRIWTTPSDTGLCSRPGQSGVAYITRA